MSNSTRVAFPPTNKCSQCGCVEVQYMPKDPIRRTRNKNRRVYFCRALYIQVNGEFVDKRCPFVYDNFNCIDE